MNATIYIKDADLWQRAADEADRLGISRSAFVEHALNAALPVPIVERRLRKPASVVAPCDDRECLICYEDIPS